MLDLTTGIADAASLGIGPLARDFFDVSGGLDVCSASYTAAAKALPLLVTPRATAIETAFAVSAARNTLKLAGRFGLFPNFRMYTAEQMLGKYGPDAAKITAGATRTNRLANAAGADLAIGASVGRATSSCECQRQERAMKKILDVKGFAIGSAFLLLIAGVGSLWLGIPFWQALLIGFVCMVILGLFAAFENGDQRGNGKSSEPPR